MNEELISKIIIGGITGGVFYLYQSVIKPYFQNKKPNSISQIKKEVKNIDNSENQNTDKDKTIWQINAVLFYILAIFAVISFMYSSIKSGYYIISLLLLIPSIFLLQIFVVKFYGTENSIFKFTKIALHYPKKVLMKIFEILF
jgi:hypothetical protein